MEDEIDRVDASEIVAPSKDWFLIDLIEWVNGTSLSFGITLTVGGSTITGELISGKAFFDNFAEKFSEGMAKAGADDEVVGKTKKFYSSFGDIYGPKKGEENKDAPDPVFVHLKDARTFNGANHSVPSNKGSYWRGRISSVDGFMMSSMDAS